MQKVLVKEKFTEDDGNGGEVDRLPGDEINVTNDRAELLRERGFIGKGISGPAKGSEEKAEAPKE